MSKLKAQSAVGSSEIVVLRRQIEAVKAAVWQYHNALDTRQHGGVAQDKCVKAVEAALGVLWNPGETLKQHNNKLSGGEKATDARP